MNKRQLISIIENMKTFDPARAKVQLEQYPTDAIAAVEMVFLAGFIHDDLYNTLVVDLGTGTGRLAISALCMGASRAVGIEIDLDAVLLAKENARAFELDNRFDIVLGDVLVQPLHLGSAGAGATVLMNPPFGVQEKGADVRFLNAAMGLRGVRIIYSFHLKSEANRAFLKKAIASKGWKLDELHETRMILPRLYKFHEKKRKEIEVDIYRIMPATITGTSCKT
nr:50S ribosomal protein L11 methyltransferase [Candidatus Sigynarchaeota archaeon]